MLLIVFGVQPNAVRVGLDVENLDNLSVFSIPIVNDLVVAAAEKMLAVVGEPNISDGLAVTVVTTHTDSVVGSHASEFYLAEVIKYEVLLCRDCH